MGGDKLRDPFKYAAIVLARNLNKVNAASVIQFAPPLPHTWMDGSYTYLPSCSGTYADTVIQMMISTIVNTELLLPSPMGIKRTCFEYHASSRTWLWRVISPRVLIPVTVPLGPICEGASTGWKTLLSKAIFIQYHRAKYIQTEGKHAHAGYEAGLGGSSPVNQSLAVSPNSNSSVPP